MFIWSRCCGFDTETTGWESARVFLTQVTWTLYQIIIMIPSGLKKTPCECKWQGDEQCFIQGWCMVLALFHIAYCCSAWLRLQNLMVLFWKAKDFPELGGEYGGQGGWSASLNLLLMFLCCSSPFLLRHPWAATSECWPCSSPCSCPAAAWPLSVQLLATPMACTPWLSWQQRWGYLWVSLFLLCFSSLLWGVWHSLAGFLLASHKEETPKMHKIPPSLF